MEFIVIPVIPNIVFSIPSLLKQDNRKIFQLQISPPLWTPFLYFLHDRLHLSTICNLS